MTKVQIGLVIAEESNPLAELRKFISRNKAKILVFPEGFLPSDDLDEACEIARDCGKWLVTGVEDRRTQGKKSQTGIVINPDGKIVGEHKKTSIGGVEVEDGWSRGDSIKVIETDLGKIGLCLCYEIFYPEVSRIYALQGARMIFNLIGTGMFDEQQYEQWQSLASARASENNVYFLGCSHKNEAIPLAFAYGPKGECLEKTSGKEKKLNLEIDLDECKTSRNMIKQRRPDLYQDITENQI